MINVVEQYGAIPLPTGVGPSSAAQIQRAIDENPGEWIFIPPAEFYCDETLHIRNRVRLSGYPTGVTWYQPSKLWFADGKGGIRLHDDTTTGGAQGSIISDLYIGMRYRTVPLPPPDAPDQPGGIHSDAGLRIKRCYVTGFRRYGICISAGTDRVPATRANRFMIFDTDVDQCLTGVFIDGYDANAGKIDHVSSCANEEWGFVDWSGLGNTYVSCHTRTNLLGPYSIGRGASGVNASVGLGNYAEGDMPPSQMGDMVFWFGGTDCAGINGGQVLLPGNSHLRLQAVSGSKVPALSLMAGAGMECPILGIYDQNQSMLGCWGPNGTLLLGYEPGNPYGEYHKENPAHLSIFTLWDRPPIQISAVNASTPAGARYAGAVAQFGVVASGPNYGDGHLRISTMTSQSVFQQTLELGNGDTWVWDGQGWKELP